MVAYTFTHLESTGGGDGSSVPGWGFLLNNELTDFKLQHDLLTRHTRMR